MKHAVYQHSMSKFTSKFTNNHISKLQASRKQVAPRRSHPAQSGETFDGPPTLERSGSERRGGAVSSLFPEGERVGVRGGAFLKGKEGFCPL